MTRIFNAGEDKLIIDRVVYDDFRFWLDGQFKDAYVVAEKYDSKNPLADSKYRVFGKIFHDAMLVKWLNGEAYSVAK